MDLQLNVLDLRQNQVKVVEDGAASCLFSSQVVSDQSGFCCLKGFEDNCHQKVYTTACPNMLLWQPIAFILGLFILIAVTGNMLALVYCILTHVRHCVFLSNLALCNIIATEPLTVAVLWDNKYGREFSFFVSGLLEQPLCQITNLVTLVSAQVSTSLLMYLAVMTFFGVSQKVPHKGSSIRRPLLAVSATWATWALVTLSFLRYQDSDPRAAGTWATCFLGNTRLWYTNISLITGIVNTFVCVVICGCYGAVAKITIDAKNKNVGRSGGTVYTHVIKRGAIIICVVILVLIPTNITLMYISFINTDYPAVGVVFLLLFPQQALVTPFMFIFSTAAFRQYIKSQWETVSMC
jgi:hypothetical protein